MCSVPVWRRRRWGCGRSKYHHRGSREDSEVDWRLSSYTWHDGQTSYERVRSPAWCCSSRALDVCKHAGRPVTPVNGISFLSLRHYFKTSWFVRCNYDYRQKRLQIFSSSLKPNALNSTQLNSTAISQRSRVELSWVKLSSLRFKHHLILRKIKQVTHAVISWTVSRHS